MHFLESELPVIKPILAIHVPFGCGEPVHKNRPSHGLVFIADGTHRYSFNDGVCLACTAGDCLYLPQGSSYTVQQLMHTDGAKKSIFAVNFLLSEQAVFAPFRLRVKNPAGMQTLFAAAEREWVKKGEGSADAVLAALYAIRAQLKRDYHAAYFSGRQQEILAPALAMIERDYDPIAASALAAACGISEVYLRRLFVRCLGVPPSVYMLQRRLQHAYELIASQEFSVTAAATAAGFCDMSYFSRAFKKHFGIAPAALRRGVN